MNPRTTILQSIALTITPRGHPPELFEMEQFLALKLHCFDIQLCVYKICAYTKLNWLNYNCLNKLNNLR